MTQSVGQTVNVVVDELTKVGDARRQAALLANHAGLNETGQGTVALIATEMASNLIKHAGGGQLVAQALDIPLIGVTIQILALDSGPGIRDMNQCLADGYSTAGSPGTGLGAIRRMASEFDMYSRSGIGTVLYTAVHADTSIRSSRQPHLQIGVIRVPCPGEQVCGDAWTTVERGGHHFILVADGLGHGHSAAEASEEAVRIFRRHRSNEPAEILAGLHEVLRSTRGAALAIARIDSDRTHISYAGVGNIAGSILNGQSWASTSMVSQNGTVGYTIRKIQTFEYSWTEGSVLLMHSDGIGTRWQLDRYPGVTQRHPALLAASLYRDHKRGRDDATVLVARFQGAEPS